MKQIGSILAGVLAVLLVAGVASAVVSLDTNAPSAPLTVGMEDPADDYQAPATSMATSTMMDEFTGTSMPSSTSPEQPAVETVDAGEAGTVTVASAAGTVTVVAVSPSTGWTYQVEQRERSEAEIRFETSNARVEVNAEFDDSRLKIEVEQRDGMVDGSTPGDCVKDDDDLDGHDSDACVDDDHGTHDDDSMSSDDHGTHDDDHGSYDDDSMNDDDHGTYNDDQGTYDDGDKGSYDEDDQGSYEDDDHRSDDDGDRSDDDHDDSNDDDSNDDDHDDGSRDH